MLRLLFLLIPALVFGLSEGDTSDTHCGDNGLTHLEGEPSALIECVNVITGHYVEMEKDLTVIGPVPLVLERSKDDTGSKGRLRGGWNHNWGGYLDLNDVQQIHHHKHTQAVFHTAHGEELKFDVRKSHKKEMHIPLAKSQYVLGVTNCGSGQISGRNHIKNTEVTLSADKKLAVVTKGDGTKIYLEWLNNRYYFYEKELLPNLNYITEDYTDSGTRYTSHDRNGKELNWLEFRYPDGISVSSWKGSPRIRVEASDGRSVEYGYRELVYRDWRGDERRNWVLKYVYREDGPNILFDHIVKDSVNSGWVVRKYLPENRYTWIDYYRYKEKNPVEHFPKNKIKDKTDFRIGRVRNLVGPAGTDTTPQVRYQFYYEKLKHDYREEGLTAVWNARGQKSVYRHKHMRLESIAKYSGEKLATKECFTWGEKDTEQNCNLMKRWLEDGNGRVLYEKKYLYDSSHNVIKDTIRGDICGDKTFDEKVKTSTYTADGRNLLLHQWDGSTHVTITYYPETNLIKSKIQHGEDGLCKREFFDYDDSAVKILEIVDDGHGSDRDDLTGVTERRLRRITVNDKGLPDTVVDLYLDEEGSERQLRKEINSYSKIGRLIKQDLYDSQDQFVYSLEWDYDPMGNITREQDASGVTIWRQYRLPWQSAA